MDIVLENCLAQFGSLNVDKINDYSNEYYLYCFQSSNQFNLVKLNSNFEMINSEEKSTVQMKQVLIIVISFLLYL